MPLPSPGRWMRPGGAALAGLVASMALPPLGVLPAFFALSVPLYWLAREPGRGRAATLGLAAGFGWFAVSMSWVSQAFVTSGGAHVLLIPFAALGLPLLLGLFWALAFLLAALACRAPVSRLLLAVGLLALAEFSRGFVLTGLPWNTPGTVFAVADVGLAAGAWIGPWGVNAMALLLAAAPVLLVLRARALCLAVLASTLLVLGLGHHHTGQPHAGNAATGMAVRLVQPNVPQRDKWEREMRAGHLNRLVSLSQEPASQAIDLIVWPESAFAGILEEEGDTLSEVARAASSGRNPVLTGVLRMEPGETPAQNTRFYNSMVLVNPDGSLAGGYDKRHLVPFGEYAPFRRFLPFVEAIAGPNDFHPGKDGGALVVRRRDGGAVRMLPLICYEVIFPDAVRRGLMETGADMIVTITNDAWFGDSIGPRQHLVLARMRAAELGVPMVRVGNNGISAVIDAHGRITHRIDHNSAGAVDAAVGGRIDTPYSRHGNLAFWVVVAAVFSAGLAIEGLTRKKPKQ